MPVVVDHYVVHYVVTFNSLFEMPEVHRRREASGRPRHQLSILYLRCASSTRDIMGQLCLTFNSLFEMPTAPEIQTMNRWEQPFNSLFEMRGW